MSEIVTILSNFSKHRLEGNFTCWTAYELMEFHPLYKAELLLLAETDVLEEEAVDV